MTLYKRPPSLVAAELGAYASLYGASVREMDRTVAASPGPSDLIDLTHGDTRAFLPPLSARTDFEAAVDDNTEAYSAYRGSATVRRLLAPRIGSLLGREVDPASELILTPGTQGGLFTSLSALAAPGDIVAFPSKEYFMDERICAYLGAKAHRIALRQSAQGIMTIDQNDLDDAARSGARGVVLSHPNNPTGGLYARETAERLATWIVDSDMWAVVDQLYCRLVFDDNEFVHIGSLPGMAERTVTLLGPSKTESMSGYRLGAAVGPRDVIEAMEQVVSLASLRTAGYSQHALRHWMDNDSSWLAERIVAHQKIRDFLIDSLMSVPGMKVSSPAGSSYVFPDASESPWALHHGSNDDYELAMALKRNGVLISPGYQFGMEGRGHFRINFSQDFDRLSVACSRIQEVLSNS
jgi:aspartate/methionine/tyrosine aminotransferase